MRSRRVAVSALGVTMRPPPSCPKADKTRSISAGLRTSAAVTDSPNEGAAASHDRIGRDENDIRLQADHFLGHVIMAAKRGERNMRYLSQDALLTAAIESKAAA